MDIYNIKNLSFKYNKESVVFNDVSLSIEEGNIYTLLGKNGAGKSTLFSILLNLTNDYNGVVLFLDEDIKNTNRRELAKNIGYVPQTPQLSFDFTAREYVAMGLAAYTDLFNELKESDYRKVEEAFEKLDIKYLIDKNMFSMSGGERQLVVIARSIVSNPKVILMDEPTAHLDIANQYKVLRIIKELKNKGYTVITSTHDPNQVALLNECAIIINTNKKIIQGKSSEILDEKVIYDIYGIKMEILNIEKYNRKICFFENFE